MKECTFKLITDSPPAVIIDLKHDFWSILGQSTYFA